MDGNYKDIGTTTADTALACKQKCDATPGCGAVSWYTKKGQYQNNCYLTSDMASSTFEANWMCYSKGYEGHRRHHIPSTCNFPKKGADCCTFFDAFMEGLEYGEPEEEVWYLLFCGETERSEISRSDLESRFKWKDFTPECHPETPGLVVESCGALCPRYGMVNPCEDLITAPKTTTTTTRTPIPTGSIEDGVKKMSTIQLIEEDKYCPNFVQLEAPSAVDLNKCAETVSLSKGKNGCHSTNGIFMHNGQDAGYCYCVTDDCTKSYASKSGLNTYKLSAVSSIVLSKEDMYCHNYIPLKSPSTFDLKSCAELVSLYKGKNGCQSTLDLLPPPFMHVGKGSGVCYCITDECNQRSASTTGLNIYRYSERICSAIHTNYTQKCSELRILGFVVINNRPCRINEISKSKSDKNGYFEVHLVATDVITKDRYEDDCLSYQRRDVPNMEMKNYEIKEFDKDTWIAVLIDPGTGKYGPDVRLRWNDIKKLGRESATERQKIVTVMSICGKETAEFVELKERN